MREKGKIRKNAKCEKYGNTKNHENVINAKNGKKRKKVINMKKCKIEALKFQKRENGKKSLIKLNFDSKMVERHLTKNNPVAGQNAMIYHLPSFNTNWTFNQPSITHLSPLSLGDAKRRKTEVDSRLGNWVEK